MRAFTQVLASFIAPGVVLLLLMVQFRLGMRGFDQASGGVLGVLEIPGLVLGWGSIAFLLPLLVWLVIEWWGISAPRMAFKILGALALGLAVGGFCGFGGGEAWGGRLGAELAAVLQATLPEVLALALLAALALPGVLLVGAGFRSAGAAGAPVARRRPARGAAPGGEGDAPGLPTRVRALFKRRKRYTNLADLVRDEDEEESEPTESSGRAWYPEPRFDEEGNELPMRFERERDVGEIRFVDEEEADEDAHGDEAAPPAAVPGAEPRHETPAASAGEEAEAADEEDDETEEELPTLGQLFRGEVDEASLSRAVGESAEVGPQASSEDADADTDEGGHEGAEEDEDEGPIHIPLPDPFPTIGAHVPPEQEELPPGVRWADEDPAAEEADAGAEDAEAGEAPAPASSGDPELDELAAGMRDLPGQGSQEASGREGDSAEVRDQVLGAFRSGSTEASSRRYLEKLEASGIFDFAEEAGASPAARKQAKSKKAARGKAARGGTGARKKAARKKAARKKSTKAKARGGAGGKKAPAKRAAAKAKGRKGSRARSKRKASAKRRGGKGGSQRADEGPAGGPQASGAGTAGAAPAPALRPATQAGPERAASAPAWRTGTWQSRHARAVEAGTREAERQAVQAPAGAAGETADLALLRRHRADPQFREAVALALKRGAVSPALLIRRLEIDALQARDLVRRMREAGVLGRVSGAGAYPTRLAEPDWRRLS